MFSVPNVQGPELVWNSLGSWIADALPFGSGAQLELVREVCGFLDGVVGWIAVAIVSVKMVKVLV